MRRFTKNGYYYKTRYINGNLFGIKLYKYKWK